MHLNRLPLRNDDHQAHHPNAPNSIPFVRDCDPFLSQGNVGPGTVGGAGQDQSLGPNGHFPYDHQSSSSVNMNLQSPGPSGMRQRVMSADRVYPDQKIHRLGGHVARGQGHYMNNGHHQYGAMLDDDYDGYHGNPAPAPYPSQNNNSSSNNSMNGGGNFTTYSNRHRSYSSGSTNNLMNDPRVVGVAANGSGFNQQFVSVGGGSHQDNNTMQSINNPEVVGGINGDNYNENMYLSQQQQQQSRGFRGSGMNNVHFRNENQLGTIGSGMPQTSTQDVYNNSVSCSFCFMHCFTRLYNSSYNKKLTISPCRHIYRV